MHRHRLLRPIAGSALAIVLALAACGGDDDAADDTTTTGAAEETTTTEAPEEETTTTAADAGDLEALFDRLLLQPEDLDPTFVDAGYEPSNEGGPCGVSVDDEFPPSAQDGTTLASEEYQLAMVEEIRIYADEAESLAAFQRAVEALSCGPNTEDPTIALGEISDVSDQLGTEGFAVPVTGADVEGAVIVARITDAIVVFQFQGAPGAAEAVGAPQPIEVAAFGVDRIITTVGE